MRNIEGLSHREIQVFKEQLSDIEILDSVDQQAQVTPSMLLLKEFALSNKGKMDLAMEI